MKGLALGIFIAILMFQLGPANATDLKTAVIYKNEACGHCSPYLDKLLPVLAGFGYAPEIKDFINSPETRSEMAEVQGRFGVPLQYQGHMLTILDGKYLLEGHVPIAAVERLLKTPSEGPVILYQDSMGETETFFLIKDGNAIECAEDPNTPSTLCNLASTRPSSFPDWALPLLIVAAPVLLIARYGF